MGFVSWLTGRNPKSHDLYEDPAKVDAVITKINNISSKTVMNASDEVKSAVSALCNTTGFEYVSGISADQFDSTFDDISKCVKEIGTAIQGKADDIKAYESASFLEKAGSTLFMATSKFGEGVLSVAEDLGDGVVSIAGWVAPKNSGFEKACESFVKTNWSHDAFNFYYNSDFAKKSAFTEDSALAGGFKIAGKVVGYLYAGGAVSGFGSGVGLGATKFGAGALKIASGTTWGATAAAGVGGLGAGTQEGINKGKSIDAAFTSDGLATGVTQAGLAFAGGKLGEYSSKRAALKAATQKADKATAEASKAADDLTQASDDATKATAEASKAADDVTNAEKEVAKHNVSAAEKRYDNAAKKLDDATQAKNSLQHKGKLSTKDWNKKVQDAQDKVDDLTRRKEAAEKYLDTTKSRANQAGKDLTQAKSKYDVAKQAADKAKNTLDTANKAAEKTAKVKEAAVKKLDKVRNSKLSSYEGYSDKITKAGQKFGKATGSTVKNGAKLIKGKATLKAATKKANATHLEAQKKLRSKTSYAGKKTEAENELKSLQNATKQDKKAIAAAKEQVRKATKKYNKADIAYKQAKNEDKAAQDVLKNYNKTKTNLKSSAKDILHNNPVASSKRAIQGAGSKIKAGGAKSINKIKEVAGKTKNYGGNKINSIKASKELNKANKSLEKAIKAKDSMKTAGKTRSGEWLRNGKAIKKLKNKAIPDAENTLKSAAKTLKSSKTDLIDSLKSTNIGKGISTIKQNPGVIKDTSVKLVKDVVSSSKTPGVAATAVYSGINVAKGMNVNAGQAAQVAGMEINISENVGPSASINANNLPKVAPTDQTPSGDTNQSPLPTTGGGSHSGGSHNSSSSGSDYSNDLPENESTLNPGKSEKVNEDVSNIKNEANKPQGNEIQTSPEETVQTPQEEPTTITQNDTGNNENPIPHSNDNATPHTIEAKKAPESQPKPQSTTNTTNNSNNTPTQRSYSSNNNDAYKSYDESESYEDDNLTNPKTDGDGIDFESNFAEEDSTEDISLEDDTSLTDEDLTTTEDSMSDGFTNVLGSDEDLSSTTTSKKSGNAAIPIIGGIAATGAAAAGTKIYMDKKKNNNNEEDYQSEEETEEEDYTENYDEDD